MTCGSISPTIRGRSDRSQAVPGPTAVRFAPVINGIFTASSLSKSSWTPQGEIGGLEIWQAVEKGIGQGYGYGAWLDHSFFQMFTGPEEGGPGIVGEAFGRIYEGAPFPVGGTASYGRPRPGGMRRRSAPRRARAPGLAAAPDRGP